MTFSFHSEAESEFYEAIDYYENSALGLGYDFSLEVLAAIQNVVSYPTVWPIIEEDIRRCLVNRFPYGVVYSIEQSEIFILAVMHLRRHPDYWKNRVRK
ncbi:MAG: type II toxin-antitoxin system RelE/ParE family toxin [Nitrospirae bacterium]|nr:type II toxin-antitoxin system RelE/ParE family toxin [Nitrospirota bacterium]MBI3377240.1 type II toxin-antitoxin system RelE/ParE family toxin [Nitrospirota bacterium]